MEPGSNCFEDNIMLRAIDKWLLPYLTRQRAVLRPKGEIHVMLCVCDHFEPLHDTDHSGALGRMDEWLERWPAMVKEFADISSDGIGPRHTLFYPIEQYDQEIVSRIADLCQASGAEGEVHLHHENDTAENLERVLLEGRDALAGHGLLAREKVSGEPRYGFIHGNWALDDSDPRGANCGVRGELGILRKTGCYADFTMPSAPHPTQTRTINSIYYAEDSMAGKSHDRGEMLKIEGPAGESRERSLKHLLMVQGPLGLNWRRRKWGVLPKVENAELTGANPPSQQRFRLWRELAPSVEGCADWVFIKLHTHGGIPQNYETLLGDGMRRFYDSLGGLADEGVKLHFVSARELTNMIHAAAQGHSGDAHEYRDHGLVQAPQSAE